MSRIGRKSWLTAVTFALVLSVTSCAGGGDQATDAGYSAPSATSSPAPTAAAKAGPLMPQGTGAPFEDLRTAPSHMPMTAAALAAGITAGAMIDGNSASPAADLRATLTALFTEHVYLSGTAVATAQAPAPNSAEFQAAAAALDENSAVIAAGIGWIAPDQETSPEELLPAADVTETLGHHAETLAGAIDSFSGAFVG